MKRILTILPSLSMGGAEHMAYELIRNLNPSQCTSIVICYGQKRGTVLETKMESLCEVLYLGLSGNITPMTMIKVMKTISYFNPDIIHAHMGGVTFAIPWCRLHKKSLVLTVHTRPDLAFSSKNQMQIRSFYNSGLLTIVAVSKENYQLTCDYYGNNQHIMYVNNGIDTSRFTECPHKQFAFINVARQDDNKNQASIIRCFKRINDKYHNTKLYLIGDGPCHEHLIKMIRELGVEDSVEIPGLCSKPEDYYAVSDVYVQSSHREAMPLSVLEALASGLPIISTNVGGLKDVVLGNGFLFDDGDEIGLQNLMERMICLDDEQRNQMKMISRQLSQNYSSQKMAEDYMHIYEEC